MSNLSESRRSFHPLVLFLIAESTKWKKYGAKILAYRARKEQRRLALNEERKEYAAEAVAVSQ
jgi:hypothetical protein